MPITVSGPDGAEIEFPDDTSTDTIKSVMAKHYGSPKAAEPAAEAPKNPQAIRDEFFKALNAGDLDTARSIFNAHPEARVDSGVDNFVKGVDRLAGTTFSGSKQPAVRPEELMDIGENFVRSTTAPLGGDYVAAAGSALTGKGFNPDAQRARREELKAANPTTAMAGELLGAGAVGKVLAPAGGGVVAQGAGTGAIAGANLSGGDPVETAIGAVGGAAGAKAVKWVGEAFSPMDALAKRLKGPDGKPVKAQDLLATFKEFETANGFKPSVAQLAEAQSVKAMTRLAENRGGAKKVFDQAAEAADKARPGQVEAAVKRGGRVDTVENITAREEAMGGSRTAAAKTTTAAELSGAQAEARGRMQVARTQTQAEIDAQRQLADRARANIQREITRATESGDVAGVERATALRDDWANETMAGLENTPILVGRELTTGPLASRGVLDALNGALRYASPSSATAERLTRLIDNIQGGRAAFITARDIDTIRRSLNSAIETGAAPRQVLREVVGPIEERARRASPAYAQFLDDYAARSREIEGFTHGRGVTAPSGATEFGQVIADNPADFARGAEQGARVTLNDAAQRAPEATARRIAADPTKVRAAMGGRGEEVVRSATEGARIIDDAYAAAQAAGLRGREAAQAIREQLRAAGIDIKARGSASLNAIREEVAARTGAVSRAAKVLTDDTAEFQAAFSGADNAMADDIAAVARGRIASTAGESSKDALRTARALSEPGAQARMSTVLGPNEAANLGTVGRTQAKAADNLAKMAGREVDPAFTAADAKKAGGLGLTAAMKTKSPGVVTAGIDAIAKPLKRLGLAPGVAEKIAKLATEPGGPEKVVDFLVKAKVGDTSIQKIARTIGIPLGVEATQ